MIRLTMVAGAAACGADGKSDPTLPGVFSFSRDVVALGRATGNDLCIDDPRVSSVHGRVVRRGNVVVFEDLFSTNGSLIERAGERLPVTPGEAGALPLQAGDLILLGDAETPVVLRFEAGAVGNLNETEPTRRASTIVARQSVLDPLMQEAAISREAPMRALLALVRETAADAGNREALLRRFAVRCLALFTGADRVQICRVEDGAEFGDGKTGDGKNNGYAVVCDALREAASDGALDSSVSGGEAVARSMIAEACARDEAVLFANVREAPPSVSAFESGAGSAICAPILTAEEGKAPRTLGALVIASRHGTGLVANDLHAAALAAHALALAWARADALAALSRANERLETQNRYLVKKVEAAVDVGLVGESEPMRRLKARIAQVAQSDAGVLILGETGSGKEVVARAIHAASRRADGVFVPVNCAAIPDTLLESQLFGHAKGAFTGATANHRGLFLVADGGTLLLDEIGDMPRELQAKLLRVLETREVWPLGATKATPVDVRVLAATHRDLKVEMAAGRFREDLFYRLNVVSVTVPALRERPDDLPLLATYLLKKLHQRTGRGPTRLSAEALAKMAAYGWPGNVRELVNEIERAAIFAGENDVVEADVLSDHIALPAPGGDEGSDDEVLGTAMGGVADGDVAGDGGQPGDVSGGEAAGAHADVTAQLEEGVALKDIMRRFEREVLVEALMRYGNNKARTARELGISRQALLVKLQQLGITS